MGDSYTRANFGALSEGAQNFALAARALRDELDDLEGKLKSKLARWDGDAQSAYWQAKAKWDQAANHMQVVVGQLGGAISDAHTNYSAAEKANTGIWA